MIIPPIQGNLVQEGFFIYAAADSNYFNKYGKALINSILRNTAHGVHMHIYNPAPGQIEFCQQPRVSVSWETISDDSFDAPFTYWNQNNLPEPQAGRKRKMLGLKQYEERGTDPEQLRRWLWKTYYACIRFVRIAELLSTPQRFLEIDVDGIVRKPFDYMLAGNDFYLYEKAKGGHLAGSILFTETQQSLVFLKELGHRIRKEIEQDNIYWFLDQHSLDAIIPQYNRGLLPIDYIDWHMNSNSAIWSAKGKRKELEVFKKELERYMQ